MANRNINDCYNLCLYIVRKERGVFLKVADFNANIDAGLLDAVELWFQGYGENQILHDAIKPLRVYQPFTSNSGGFVTYPSNYLHLIGTPFTVSGSTITNGRFINEDEFQSANTSQLRPLQNSDPIFIDTATGLSIYPQSTQTGAYWYLRRPTSPLLVVTTVGRAITYDSTNSVQIELLEIYWNNIIARALKYSGVNMDEKGVIDFANQYQNETT